MPCLICGHSPAVSAFPVPDGVSGPERDGARLGCWSGDEDFLAVPVEVLPPGTFGVAGEQEGVQERRPTVHPWLVLQPEFVILPVMRTSRLMTFWLWPEDPGGSTLGK